MIASMMEVVEANFRAGGADDGVQEQGKKVSLREDGRMRVTAGQLCLEGPQEAQ